jgi:HSP20 family molecular chaperone IbpA
MSQGSFCALRVSAPAPLAGGPRRFMCAVMTGLVEAFFYGVMASVLIMLLASRTGASDPDPAEGALTVFMSETSDAVLLHIHASGAVEPGSVEVRLAGRKTVVLARDAAGHSIRSPELHLPESVVEEGASAEYEADGTLMVTLRKEASARRAAPPGDQQGATP